MTVPLSERLQREISHGKTPVAVQQAEIGWISPAGVIRRQRRAEFMSRGLPRSTRVLEIGAGTGLQTMDLLAAYDEVVGIDISPELLGAAERRAPGATYRVMDAHCPDFPDASFDLIVGVSVLHHLDWDMALRSYYRLLKPGGRVRFTEPNLLNPWVLLVKTCPPIKRWVGDSPDETAFTKWRIRRSLNHAGFVDVVVTTVEFLHCSTPARLIPLVLTIERWALRSPFRAIAGSLFIEARKP